MNKMKKVRDGLYTEWYEHGQKKWEVTYKDGGEGGKWTYWYEHGQKKWEMTFKDVVMISKKLWNEDGSLKK